MPQIFEFKCNKCDFAFPQGWGSLMYVKDKAGNKIVCPHPAEAFKIAEVLKIDKKEAYKWLLNKSDSISPEIKKLIDEQIGTDYCSICLDCLHQFEFDLKKEERKCPKCGSNNVKTAIEMVNQACPKCKQGIIVKFDTGIIS